MIQVESGKKTSVILWSSIVAAVAGVVAVAALVSWKSKQIGETVVSDHLRDVQDVLSDCYQKIREIENRIPDAIGSSANSLGSRAGRGATSKGKPVFDT
jgi:hypothetical protein